MKPTLIEPAKLSEPTEPGNQQHQWTYTTKWVNRNSEPTELEYQ